MPLSGIALKPGITHYPGYLSGEAQRNLLDALRDVARDAPFFTPTMPRTGTPFSVRMTNCGDLGWVSDRAGYRYQPMHPETGGPWPAMPDLVRQAWDELAFYPLPPEACLVNFYATSARMGLHQDRDEQDLAAPVVSLSLGDTAIFRIGNVTKGGPTTAIKLQSGDALTFGGPARLVYHGIDRVIAGSSTLLEKGGRINLTLRRVSAAPPDAGL
jgi:alkylated DNA repair protein (DNA oxidative demethylase)